MASAGAKSGDDDYVSCSVFVAVRARPFNSRERAKKSKCCLKFYNGDSVQITAPAAPAGKGAKTAATGESKPFAFDRAYHMDTPQDVVFRDMGLPVVAATLEGYNACIFAYGQTGSGKSFSMLGPSDAAHILAPPSQKDMAAPTDSDAEGDAAGSDADDGRGESGAATPPPAAAATEGEAQRAAMYEMRGLIPRILEHVFTDLDDAAHANAAEVEKTKDLPPAERAAKLESTVTVSYLEIYQEKVRCLLRPDKGSDLRVRNDPKKGAFVEGLTKTKVTSAREALELLSKGNAERVVGSTNMNDKSSRSHAIFAFELEQVRTLETEDGPSATKLTSAVNLVDLAGSERAKSTGAEGERLKEGAGINKSLTVLGLVISGLADASKAAASGGKGGKTPGFVPYRDSKLTWLLKENLGGNSKTFMLSALSPADVNYDETLSTLRYADRAKAIVTKACINEDAKDKVIRQLQAEVARLKNEGAGASPATPQPSAGPAAAAPDAPYLVGVEGCGWPLFRAPLGCTLVIGRNPAVGNPAHRVVVGEPDDDDIAELHAELEIPSGGGAATLRAVSAPDYHTFVGDGEEPLRTASPVEVPPNESICLGDGIIVKYVDPKHQKARRARGQSRAGGALTARGPGSTSPAPKPRDATGSAAASNNNSGRPAVPSLALTARGPPRPESASTGGNGGGGATVVPKLSIPVVGGTPKTALARQGAPSTTRLANATPRATTGMHARFADARDELMVVNNHTFVLLGDVGSGKSAFRATLGKEWSFFDKKKLPETRPTLGFEVERLDRVGTTTKTDLTLLELSGNRVFTPLSWMVPPQGRSTFVIFFKLHGTPEAPRCDLQYFQPFVDLIRSACPTSDNSILLVGTHRDCLPDTPDSAIVDMLLAIQTEISNYWSAVEPIPENRPVIRARFATSALTRTVIASTASSGRRDSANSGSLTARLFSGGGGGATSGADPSVRKMTDMLQWLAKHAVERWRNDTVFMKGLVPKRLMTLLDSVRAKRAQGRFAVLGTEFKAIAKEVDERYSNTKGDLLMHTQLLHSWLRVYHHYRHTNLKRHVFVDVEWVFKLIMTLCCCGALVQRSFFNPPDAPPATDAAERFIRQYPGLPFDPAEVKRADPLMVLWTGLLTTQTASALFRKVIAEKRYTATEVSVAMDLLAQFDLTFSAAKLLQMPPDGGEWTSLQVLIGDATMQVTKAASPDPVHVLPGFFAKPAPETVTVFVPETLGTAGPTVCFTLHSVPVLFFSRLVTRLSRFSRGVFYGKRNFWGDCAWLVASDRCRVLLRLVSRSLFITFHDHEEQTTAEVQQTRHQAQGSGLTARGPAAVDGGESTLDDECYEAYLAMILADSNRAAESGEENDLARREALYLAIRRGMVMRRETDLQALIRQEIRDLIAESPGASFKERDRLPLCEGGKWREVTGAVKGMTMHEGQRDFLRLRELIAKQQQAAAEEGGKPYFSPAPGEEADPAPPEDELVGEQAERLHQRLAAEADHTDIPSHAYHLDVDRMLHSLTANRFLTDDTLERVSQALEDVASARATVGAIERDRFRLFAARDAEGADEEAENAVPEKLPGLATAQRHAMQSEVIALDMLVAALAEADA